MRSILAVTGLAVAGVAFASPYLSKLGPAGGPFPKAGMYRIVSERTGGRTHSEMYLDVSNRQSFEKLVAADDGVRCRDRHVSVGAGSFNVAITCDTHDGDIHNIAIERHGTYSAKSFTVSTTTRLWGMPIVETASYQLRDEAG